MDVHGDGARASARRTYAELDTVERRTFWACFAAFGLDSMDTTIYALVIPALIAVLHLTRPEAGYLATIALVGVAVGGWGAGIVADRLGRVRILQATILWVALCTFAAAFANSFGQFAVIRFLQGIGYGGEVAVSGVLISEVVRPALRGRVASSVQSGYALGYAVSVLLMPVIASAFPQTIGWRVFFAIGLVPAFMVMFVRRAVPESRVFTQTRDAGAPTVPFWTIFARGHLGRTLPALVMAGGIFGGAYIMITWLPTYLRTGLHLSVSKSTGYLVLNILGSLVGPACYGVLADRWGRRPAFAAFILMQAVNVAVLLLLPVGRLVTILLSFFLGAFQGGLASGMLPTFAELYPTSIRASGQGFCMGGGRGLASILPAAVGVLSATMPLGRTMGICALCAYGIALCAVVMLPETRGVDLRAADDDAAARTAVRDRVLPTQDR